jgi:2-polyprenyl-3-methyl-5-hydroxy-6-metoxy-1,4-benzoquinol methylase
MGTQELDGAKAEAFAGRMVGLLNDAFLSVLVSIGHQTGLYEAMAGLPPSTSAEIARAAGLQERYVREWLGAMVTGGIVEHDPASGSFTFPPEHAALLTRAAGPDNLAFFTQYVGLCGHVEQGVIECFRNGGGVPYSAYPRFQELQGEESAALFDAKLVDVIVPLVPGLADRLRAGIDVLDVGCGQGHAMNVLAQAFPASRFAGYDVAEEGVAAGRAEAAALGLANVRFEATDIAALAEPSAYDLITAVDVVHDLAQPERVLRGIADALRPGATFLMIDIQASSHLHENLEHPLGPLLYSVSVMHCMTVSLSQGGAGLGTVWGEQAAVEMLRKAGFNAVDVKHLEGDVFHSFYVAAKD